MLRQGRRPLTVCLGSQPCLVLRRARPQMLHLLICALALPITLVLLFAPPSSPKCPGVENNLKPRDQTETERGTKGLWAQGPSGKFTRLSRGSGFGCPNHPGSKKRGGCCHRAAPGTQMSVCVLIHFPRVQEKSIVSFAGNKCVHSK